MRREEKKMTKEWISRKLEGMSQFEIVNYFIELAKEKVSRGEHDEITPENQNIAVEVLKEFTRSGKQAAIDKLIDALEIIEEKDDQESKNPVSV